MPKQINTYTFGQGLVRKFGLKGRFQPVLDETIVPVTVVDSTLVNRKAVGGQIGTASGAGNQNRIQFSNPEGSNVIVTIKRWWAVSGAPLTDFVSLNLQATDRTISGFRIWRDSNFSGLPRAGFTGAVAAAIVLGGPQYHLDTDSIVWEEEWVLTPDTHLEWRQNGQNTTLDVWVDWEETDITASLGA